MGHSSIVTPNGGLYRESGIDVLGADDDSTRCDNKD